MAVIHWSLHPEADEIQGVFPVGAQGGARRSVVTDALRAERTMVAVRWVAAVWALAQVQLYDAMPYPPRVLGAAHALIGVLVVGNLGLWGVARRDLSTRNAACWVAACGLTFEVAIGSAFVWLYAFDAGSALWAVLFLVPVAGAARFQLAGALGAWTAVAALYVGRELWASARYASEFSIPSVSFRCGMLFLVALVVGLLTRDLVRERERARGLEDWRARMVTMLAHDLRSPLAAIDMALQGLTQSSDSDRATFVTVARRQVARVTGLTRDLLDAAADEQGVLRLERQTTDFGQIIERVLTYTDPTGTVDVDVPHGLTVHADPRRVEQVLANLVSNALRHGRPPVGITASERGSTVTVQVSDHGDGLPAGRRSNLSARFVDRSDDDSSVGLGLWVASHLVAAHDSELTYRDTPDGGATFLFELPRGSGADGSSHAVRVDDETRPVLAGGD